MVEKGENVTRELERNEAVDRKGKDPCEECEDLEDKRKRKSNICPLPSWGSDCL